MENVTSIIQNDPLSGVVLAAIKKGPLATTQIHKLFQRNRSANEIDQTLERLRSAKQIISTREKSTGGRPKTVWSLRDKANDEKSTTSSGKHRIFCSVRYPSLTIGKAIKFQAGFYQTDSAEKQRQIEQSGEYNLSVHDITETLRRLSKQKARILLSSQPSVDIEHHPRLKTIEFKPVADGLYLFVSENPELASFIEHSQLFRSEQVREVPRTLMEAA
jgi:hypothetical protein